MAHPRPIVIVRKKAAHGGHHGGAWKVAYADFVTAMMALFIVLWLLNSSKQIQEAVGGYFKDPTGTSNRVGSGKTGAGDNFTLTKDNMSKLKDELQKAVRKVVDFEKLKNQIEMTVTSEGLRIELLESQKGTFFASGVAEGLQNHPGWRADHSLQLLLPKRLHGRRVPYAGLIEAASGDFYGTTSQGGTGSPAYGTIFRITPSGTLTTLYSFCSQSACADGEQPFAGLVQGTDGDFYGTTAAGGANGYGTIFKITRSGTLTTLYSFCSQSGCTDGKNPLAGLAQATNGDFYGTTQQGGANCVPDGCGTVFKITPGGMLTTLYSFCAQSGCTDGSIP